MTFGINCVKGDSGISHLSDLLQLILTKKTLPPYIPGSKNMTWFLVISKGKVSTRNCIGSIDQASAHQRFLMQGLVASQLCLVSDLRPLPHPSQP